MGKSKFRKKLGKSAGKSLLERTKESYKTKDGVGFKNYISDECKLPRWRCSEDDHCIDIIPFIAGSKHPNVEEGKATYNVDVWAHQNIGPGKQSILCPARNYDKRCPICEKAEKMSRTEGHDEEELKTLYPKRRVVYYIVCYDSPKEESRGVQIWEASHFSTEANIISVARNRRTGGYENFADPDNGKSIEFTKKGKGIKTRYEGYKLLDRDDPISDEIMDQAEDPIDEFLDLLSFEEISEIALISDDDLLNEDEIEDEIDNDDDDDEEDDDDDDDDEEDDDDDDDDEEDDDDDDDDEEDDDDDDSEELIEDLSLKEKKKVAKILGIKIPKKESALDSRICMEDYEDIEEAIEEMEDEKIKVVKKRKKKK